MAIKELPKTVHPKPAAKTTHAAGTAAVKPAVAKPIKPVVTAQGDQFVQGAKPQAPKLHQQVRAGGFANSAAAVLGRNVVTTAQAALDILVKMYAESPSAAAAEFQRMALSNLKPDKGKVIG